MKKLLFAAVCGLLSGSLVNAQESQEIFASNSNPADRIVHSTGTAAAINARAVKNFNRSFPGKKDENWYAIKDGFVAQFSSPHITRCYFDRKGNWRYSVASYSETSLPARVRSDVKSSFPEFSIFGVQEIKSPDKLVYLVHLESMLHWKTVRVFEDEMEVIEDLDK